MRKLTAVVLVFLMTFCGSFAFSAQVVPGRGMEKISPELLAAAKAEGELVVYGSCEEAYMMAACRHFEELYGIKVSCQRLSTGEVQAKISEENGHPSADIWFGGTNEPVAECAEKGLLEPYQAANAAHLISDKYKDAKSRWHGIYTGILGVMVNREELERLKLPKPADWDDLLKPEYKGLIWLSNPNTAGTAKLFINTMVQLKGHDKAMEYLVKLDRNIAQYTKSGAGPSKKVGIGECVIGIGFLHDGLQQIISGYDNIDLIVPKPGTAYEVGPVAIFRGAKHPNAAKLWVEYALSPECVELAPANGTYSFPVIDNAAQPKEVKKFGLNMDMVMNYDFNDARANTSRYVDDYFKALGVAADSRFKTK